MFKARSKNCWMISHSSLRVLCVDRKRDLDIRNYMYDDYLEVCVDVYYRDTSL